jgi:hypothetical protein
MCLKEVDRAQEAHSGMDYGSLHGDDLLREILRSNLRIEQLLMSQGATWPDPAPAPRERSARALLRKAEGLQRRRRTEICLFNLFRFCCA